jgi:phenylacetate-coenzyme A ligase PaaK-like adenylate-forming protein
MSAAIKNVIHDAGDGTLVFASDLRRLQARLEYVRRRIPAYRDVGKPGEELSPLDFLAQFPVYDKRGLLEQGERLFELELDSAVVLSETSGTTGMPALVTPRSAEELRWNSRNIARAFNSTLSPALDRAAILHPAIMSPFAEACGLALAQLGIPYLRIYPIPKVCSYERLIRVLRSYDITAIMTTATLAYKVLYERSLLDTARGAWKVDKYLLTGELLTEASLRNLSLISGGKASPFVYGSSEAATCFNGCEGGKYHPCLRDFVFELVPIDDRRAYYELLITWLNTGVRPLVRYNTHDVVSYGVGCPCGDPGVWLDAHGRNTEDALGFEQRRKLDEIVFGVGTSVYHYDLSIGPSEAVLTLILDGEPPDGEAKRVARLLTETIQRELGFTVGVVVNPRGHEFYDFSPTTKTERVSRD